MKSICINNVDHLIGQLFFCLKIYHIIPIDKKWSLNWFVFTCTFNHLKWQYGWEHIYQRIKAVIACFDDFSGIILIKFHSWFLRKNFQILHCLFLIRLIKKSRKFTVVLIETNDCFCYQHQLWMSSWQLFLKTWKFKFLDKVNFFTNTSFYVLTKVSGIFN